MKQYLELMHDVWNGGETRGDRTGVGTRSLFGERIKVDLRFSFPLLTTKTIHFRSVMIELLWFLRGRTDNGWLNERGVTIWNEWATAEQTARFGRSEGDLGPIYGHQWTNFGGDYYPSADIGTWPPPNGINQLDRLINDLRNNPMSRRHIVTGWNPAEADQVALPPCHTLFQCYVHTDGRLDLHLFQRSADLFLGVPFNIASYALLTHLLAHTADTAKIGGEDVPLTPGSLTISFGDVHLYLNHQEQVLKQLGRHPGIRPLLNITAPRRTPLDQYDEDDIVLHDYNPQGKIPAPVAV